MTSPRVSLPVPFDQDDLWYVTVKDKSLTVNVLWEVAYGVFKEALHLNLLEDFNATEADLVELKNDILATWKSRDKHKMSSLRPTFIHSSTHPFKHPLQLELWSGRNSVTSHEDFRPTTRDPESLCVYVIKAGYLPHSELLFVGIDCGIQFQSHDGVTLETINLKSLLLPVAVTRNTPLHILWFKFSRPTRPTGYWWWGTSSFGSGTSCPFIPCSHGWDGTHYNHLLLCSGDNSVSLTQVEPQGKHLFCQYSRQRYAEGNPTTFPHLSKQGIGSGWGWAM